ncbi:hypothetical protein HYH03_005196 [Edaphochlamys debaryana]|uniref:Complex 1 LYR protein domain-containing protein n=1 Tax=Edaphochlamys debaryana TaxID=47281 RepID=A0A835Y6A1_9CHLO|nr:hypothetical protein HYH03_005196 [Edaphochlamys debaryana]|eukprot:KAG2496788.1 hypothetical protein HYH03_005196 [Edaphochlamys debaryana]
MATNPSIAVYRQLFRTIRKTFSGDASAITAARRELKSVFAANRHLTDQSRIQECVAEAVDANEFIRDNVIQAVKKDCGNYEVSPEKAAQLRNLKPEDMRPAPGRA